MASQEWHWEQGTKYAAEAIKTTLLLNGASAIALMTFAANTQKFSSLLIPLISFVIGAVLSALAFVAAYMAQLNFGTAAGYLSDSFMLDKQRLRKRGQLWSAGAMCSVLLSVLAFGLGISWAASVLPQLAAK